MLLVGYGSYMAGTAVGLSGIVCVMFCAMVAGGYAVPNLSPAGLSASKSVFAVLASCMEMFVFCYIGISLFMEPQEWHCVAFTVSTRWPVEDSGLLLDVARAQSLWGAIGYRVACHLLLQLV